MGVTLRRRFTAFREAEVWESDDLLNRALTPIACGDVFELDRQETATKASKQKFVLLGQPCDISLRPEKGKRDQETASLVPLRNRTTTGKVDPKLPLLPFTLRGEQWACDFRNASAVRLAILDLASFRLDGRVRVDDGHVVPKGLLVAQQKIYTERTDVASKALDDPDLRPNAGATSAPFQLTFASADTFKHIHEPVFEAASSQTIDGQKVDHPKRVTWRLRRCGRIRMPYAAALLDQYTNVMARQAFDLDFMSPGQVEGGAAAEEGEPVGDAASPMAAPEPEAHLLPALVDAVANEATALSGPKNKPPNASQAAPRWWTWLKSALAGRV